ncbi:MAG TPA: hypothetical protein PKK26_08935 [Candidatus Wallbacteria bacterium]|nr:hypothetical protein [Candidatus Wallbacteria bacterium]
MTRFFGGALLFFAGFIIFSAVSGGRIAMFINFHGMLISFFFISAGFVASNWTMADFISALSNKSDDEKHALRLVDMLSYFEKISVISSIIGLVTGAVIILSVIGDASRIGSALAVALLMPFYCLIFYMFAAILKSRTKLAARKFLS